MSNAINAADKLKGLNQSGFQAFFSDSLQIHSDIPGTHF